MCGVATGVVSRVDARVAIFVMWVTVDLNGDWLRNMREAILCCLNSRDLDKRKGASDERLSPMFHVCSKKEVQMKTSCWYAKL